MKLLCYLFIIFITASCASIQPEAPEIIVKSNPTLIQQTSTVVVPIKINLAPYFKETDKSIPKKFTGKQENCEGVSFAYVFNRDPISFKGSGQSILFDVDGEYSLDLNYCVKCTDIFGDKPHCVSPRVYVSCGNNGETMRKVEVGYTTDIKLTSDFKLKSTTNLRKFETIDPCEISLFKYDATSLLKKEVTKSLKNLENEIDKKIGTVNLKAEAEKAWNVLSKPISLGKFGFLQANPSKIGFENLKFNGNTATADLSLTLNPKLSTLKLESKTVTFPKLTEVTDENGFNINLDIIATYDSLSTILTSELKGKEILIKGKKVIFETIDIFGASNQQLSIKIGFSGKKNGTLFLVGTPLFDQTTQIISFPDLNFDLKTKNALLKSAKWLFNDKITEILRENSTINLTPHLLSVQKIIEKQINTEIQEGVFIKGSIEKISLNGIYPNSESLTLRVNSKGNIELEMK